jgi:hypothetical protein
MDVFSMEVGIWLSFVKTSEFGDGRGGGGLNTRNHPLGTPLDMGFDTRQIQLNFLLFLLFWEVKLQLILNLAARWW